MNFNKLKITLLISSTFKFNANFKFSNKNKNLSHFVNAKNADLMQKLQCYTFRNLILISDFWKVICRYSNIIYKVVKKLNNAGKRRSNNSPRQWYL